MIYTIVVGAPFANGNIPFECCGGTAAIAPDLPLDFPNEGENFGNSVDIRGDGIVVGAVNDRISPPGASRPARLTFCSDATCWEHARLLRLNK